MVGSSRREAALLSSTHIPPLRQRIAALLATGRGATGAGLALLALALVIGLATAGDYGFTIDEFNTDDYGPKALAWYTSGFTDRSHFETVEEWLWAYGPWFQIVVAAVQATHLFDPVTARHALTFLVGLLGLAALLPLARLTVGRWAGPVAILLCLTTGYIYGHLFFTPIDVPFMAAMTWATLAVVVMAAQPVPTWRATILAGLATGLAIATRTGGILTHGYLFGAMALCALEVVARRDRPLGPALMQIALRAGAVVVLAWLTAIALWPWLQIGNPFHQFAIAFEHFRTIQTPFTFLHWGETVATDDLPASYIPMQLLARLPEGFLLLLVAAAGIALVSAVMFLRDVGVAYRRRGIDGLRHPALALARSRGVLVVMVAALFPPVYIALQSTTLYDGIRHVFFVLPLLALLAAGALLRLAPVLLASRLATAAAAALIALHLATTLPELVRLHPLQYVATNSLTGGTAGAHGRFELDYWSAAGTTALRKLERELAADPRYALVPARVVVCIPYREMMIAPLRRRPKARFWQQETDLRKADFMIGTERWNCGQDVAGASVIDEVRRQDRDFAWTYAGGHGRKPSASTVGAP